MEKRIADSKIMQCSITKQKKIKADARGKICGHHDVLVA
jgi:hypothetical protein